MVEKDSNRIGPGYTALRLRLIPVYFFFIKVISCESKKKE
jgi:hypothetical protein